MRSFTFRFQLFLTLVLAAPAAQAGFVTLPNVTSIFSANPPFNAANSITVNWLSTITIYSVNYNNIANEAIQDALFALPGTLVTGQIGNGAIQSFVLPHSPVDDVFFVDSIDFCGAATPNVVGCATLAGEGIALRSDFIPSGGGLQTVGHELGHNLGLDHCQTVQASCPAAQPDGSYLNLMNAYINGSTTLTAAQVATIISSPLIRNSGAGNFIDLQPIVFANTPEPGAMTLVGLGLALLFFVAPNPARPLQFQSV